MRGGKRANGRERESMGFFRKRSSTFSLEFLVIGPASPDKARSKVAPHCKDYTWVPISGSFDKLRKGRGFFSYLLYFFFKGHIMDGDLLKPGL